MERTNEKVLQTDKRKFREMTDTFIILIVVMVSWIYNYVKTYQAVYVKICAVLFYTNNSIKLKEGGPIKLQAQTVQCFI